MTKKKSVFKAIVAVLVSLFCLRAIASLFRGEKQTVAGTVNEQVENASGAFYLKLNDETELQVSEESEKTLLGSEKTETLTIDGGTINITGAELGVIEAANDGMLVFKNTTIKDKTENKQSAAYKNYIRFGGKLHFENCTIESVYLKNDAQAEFVNCTFISTVPRWYSAWVADGSALFENCKFTGYRGIKINEFKNEDVLNVSINGCTFENISEKVGIAIGKFLTEPLNGVISVKKNRFIDCQQWDAIGSIEGIDGMYEADTYTSELEFIQEENVVEYTSNVRQIRYVLFENRKNYKEVYSSLWYENGNYPTEYELGKEYKIDTLRSGYDDNLGEVDFYGWYVDRACTERFDGIITSDMTTPLTLYGKIETTGLWTGFY